MGEPEIDPTNQFLIAAQGEDLIFMRPPRRMTRAQALVLAAWIVLIVGDDALWQRTVEAVQNT